MNPLRSLGNFFLDIVETAVVALSIFLVIYLFFMQPHQVSGQSMEPNFHSGEYVLTDKVSYQTGHPQRGDVVVFHAPPAAGCAEGTNCDFIKRVIGLPGESVSVHDGALYVSGQRLAEPYLPPELVTKAGDFTNGGREIFLGPDEYFLVGDNRPFSSDGRAWGPVPRKNIVGRAFFRYWPLNRAQTIKRLTYPSLSASPSDTPKP